MNTPISRHNNCLTIGSERNTLGESPRAAHGQLRWVDIQERTLHRIALDDLSRAEANLALGSAHIHSQPAPDQIACIIPTQRPDVWMGFGRQGIWMLQDDGQHKRILDAPFDSSWQRFNDGCCDEWGRIWITTLIDDKRAALAHLYCLQQGELQPVMGGLTTGNGMAYSAQHRKLFVADTFTKTIRRFDVCGNDTTIRSDGWQYTYSTATQRPDGACMIDDNHYAVAVIDGLRIDVFNFQKDQPVASIAVPLRKPTMPCILPKPASALVLTSAAITPEQVDEPDGHLCMLPRESLWPLGFSEPAPVHLYRF